MVRIKNFCSFRYFLLILHKIKTMRTKKFYLSTLIGCVLNSLLAQNIGINPTGAAPDNSAGLDVNFTNKGLLIPRVALTSALDNVTIPSPANSLLVYNTGTGGLTPAGYYYNAGTPGTPNWVQLLPSTAALSGSGVATRVAFWTGATTLGSNANLYWDNVNSRLGVGTSTPANRLGVRGGNIGWGNTSEVNLLQNDQGGSIELGGTNSLANPISNGKPYIDFHFGTGSAQDFNTRIINAANNRLDFVTSSGGTIMSINGSSVGIGTTAPSTQLHTTGTVRFSNYSSGPNGAILRTNSMGDLLITNFTGNVADVLRGDGTFGPVSGGVTSSCASINYVPKMTGASSIGCSQIFDNGTNVGIGTATPGYKLTVSGGPIQVTVNHQDKLIFSGSHSGTPNTILWNNGQGLRFWDFTNGELVRITNIGRVGIGTTSPVEKLHVAGNARIDNVLTVYPTARTVIKVMDVGAGGYFSLYTDALYDGPASAPTFLFDGMTISSQGTTFGDISYSSEKFGGWHYWLIEGTRYMRLTSYGLYLNGGTYNTTGADLAEEFSHDGTLEEGDVVVISSNSNYEIEKCSEPQAPNVLGIVATKPGVILNSPTENDFDSFLKRYGKPKSAEERNRLYNLYIEQRKKTFLPITLAGRTPCKVDATKHPIKKGDLLCTSSTPGYAEKLVGEGYYFAIALESLESGKGKIMVVLSKGKK